MRAGELRRRVRIQQRSTAQDSFGQQGTVWTDLLTGVPANIQALSGRELLAAQAIVAEVTHTISVRFARALADPIATARMRVVYVTPAATQYFAILSAQILEEKNRQIDLLCVEGPNAG